MNKIERLAKDFASWGVTRARRVLAGVRKHGVLFHQFVSNDASKG